MSECSVYLLFFDVAVVGERGAPHHQALEENHDEAGERGSKHGFLATRRHVYDYVVIYSLIWIQDTLNYYNSRSQVAGLKSRDLRRLLTF